MAVEEDGSFNEEFILSDTQRETITVAAMDWPTTELNINRSI